jgi:hypothetical protein
MTKLATYIAGYSLFQVEIKKGYGVNEWRDDIKKCLLSAGLKDKPTTFLFNDAQIINEIMLEVIRALLLMLVPQPGRDLENINTRHRTPPNHLVLHTNAVYQ